MKNENDDDDGCCCCCLMSNGDKYRDDGFLFLLEDKREMQTERKRGDKISQQGSIIRVSGYLR